MGDLIIILVVVAVVLIIGAPVMISNRLGRIAKNTDEMIRIAKNRDAKRKVQPSQNNLDEDEVSTNPPT